MAGEHVIFWRALSSELGTGTKFILGTSESGLRCEAWVPRQRERARRELEILSHLMELKLSCSTWLRWCDWRTGGVTCVLITISRELFQVRRHGYRQVSHRPLHDRYLSCPGSASYSSPPSPASPRWLSSPRRHMSSSTDWRGSSRNFSCLLIWSWSGIRFSTIITR